MRLRPCERGRAIEQAKRKAQRYQLVTDVHVSSSSGSFILLRLSLPNQQQLYSQGARHLITVGKAGAAIAIVPRILATILNASVVAGMFVLPRPLMGWSGRAPAPPASQAGKGRQKTRSTPCLRHPIPQSP